MTACTDGCTCRHCGGAWNAHVEEQDFFSLRDDLDAITVENEAKRLALKNVMRLALELKRGRRDPREAADHLLRFCREGGVEPTILRVEAEPLNHAPSCAAHDGAVCTCAKRGAP
jgi:hypothetical protein